MKPDIDPHSPTWQAVDEWARRTLERHRAELESPAMDESATTMLRGRIAMLRELINLPNPIPTPIVATHDGYGID